MSSEFGGAQPRHELPRLALVRNVTDRTVLDCVYAGRRVTRVDVAGLTGISKPTISESVRRLTDAGVLVESGSVAGRRGRAAVFFELAPTAGGVLALQVSQEGIWARATDLGGEDLATQFYAPHPAGTVEGVLSALRAAAGDGIAAASGRLRAIAISVANPVDPVTDEIIALPHTPFPEGLIDPIGLFGDLTDAPVLIDNDVNLAARAELAVRPDPGASFGYLYAGAGLGMSLCLGGHIVRGANGLAGEIAYLPDVGRAGRILLDRFIDLGLVRPGSTTIDVPTDAAEAGVAERGWRRRSDRASRPLPPRPARSSTRRRSWSVARSDPTRPCWRGSRRMSAR